MTLGKTLPICSGTPRGRVDLVDMIGIQGSLYTFIQVSLQIELTESVELYSKDGLEKAVCW